MDNVHYLGICLIGLIYCALGNARQAGGVSFRTQISTLKYRFPNTESTTKTNIYIVFSTIKCGGTIINIPSRDRALGHFYRLALDSSGSMTFTYQLTDGRFNLKITPGIERSFCNGHRHSIFLKRYDRKVYYVVNNGNPIKHIEGDIGLKTTFSKPDSIIVGGYGEQKFIGCIYNATVELHWTSMPVTTLDLTQMYMDGDVLVSSRDLLVGACVDANAECRESNTKLRLVNLNGAIANPIPGWLSRNVMVCSWVIVAPEGYRVKLKLRLFRINDSNSCSHNYVEVMDGSKIDSPMKIRYCNPVVKSPWNVPMYSVGRYLTVVLRKRPNDVIEFVATYRTANLSEGPCPVRAELKGNTGRFSTPDFPYNHGNRHLCSWIISVPRDMHVLVTFDSRDFNLNGCSNCACDYMEIRKKEDGRNVPYERYCGEIAPSPIYHPGHRLTVAFVSDSKENRQGFRATYKAIGSLKDQCSDHIVLTNVTGNINSPRFPLPYPGNMDCVWEIRGTKNTRVELTFTSPLYFDMECTDYIELWDGSTKGTRTFLKKLCISDQMPSAVFSKGSKLFVRFKSDKYKQLNRNMAGFGAKYKIKKSGTASKKVSGVIKLKNIPLMTLSLLLLSSLIGET